MEVTPHGCEHVSNENAVALDEHVRAACCDRPVLRAESKRRTVRFDK
jgi:hypothetical protein